MPHAARCIWLSMVLAGLSGLLVPPAHAARTADATLLRYHFQMGNAFTVRFVETLHGTFAYGGIPFPISEVTTGLEQGAVAHVYADGSALLRFRFADLTENNAGTVRPVPAGAYSITQRIASDGAAGPAREQGAVPALGGYQLGLSALAPIEYAGQAVAPGSEWTVPYAGPEPGLNVLTTAHVQLHALAHGVGAFSAYDTARFQDMETGQTIAGTAVFRETVRQAIASGALLALQQTLHVRGSARATGASTHGATGPVATTAVDLVLGLSASAAPNSAFLGGAGAAAPTPSVTPRPAATAVPSHAIQVEMDAAQLAFPPVLPAGLLRITAENSGNAPAGIALARLAPSVTPDQAAGAVQGASGDPASLTNLFAFLGGIADLAPHAKTAMTFALTPGAYQLLGGAGGQQTVYFTVTPNTAAVIPPRADAGLTLQAAGVSGMPTQLRTGAITFAITNADSAVHRLDFLRVQAGKGAGDVTAALAAGSFNPDALPWIQEVIGIDLLSPGQTVWPNPTLVPGAYVIIYPPLGAAHGLVVGAFSVVP